MRIAIAYAERDGATWPDAEYATAMEQRLLLGGHAVEQVVVPLSSKRSPQEHALACQVIPTDAYGDELWSLNFPACLLPHRVRRVWFTRAEPFDTDDRAPRDALPLLLGSNVASVHVACHALRKQLGLDAARVQIGLPPAPRRERDALETARNGTGVLLVPEPSRKPAASHCWEALRPSGVTSVEEVVAGDGDDDRHRGALAAASAVLIREDAIGRLFDHALLSISMGTPVLLLSDAEDAKVWWPKLDPTSALAKNMTFDQIARAQARWLDEEITLACERADAQTQPAP